MKKKKHLVVILLLLVLLSSGCTKYLSDADKKRVVNESTGQAVVSNILCLPEDKENLKIYETNKENLEVEYDSLKSCKDYTPSDIKYTGLWETIFIKPLAWLIIKVGLLFNNYGLSVMFLGFIISVISLLGFKGTILTSVFIPLLILAVPILDTLFAILRRFVHHQKITDADKLHLHHQLLGMKFSHRNTVLIIYGVNILFAIASIFYLLGEQVNIYIRIGIYFILFGLVFWFVNTTNIITEKQIQLPKKKK